MLLIDSLLKLLDYYHKESLEKDKYKTELEVIRIIIKIW